MGIIASLFSKNDKHKKHVPIIINTNIDDIETFKPKVEKPQIKPDTYHFDHIKLRTEEKAEKPLKVSDTRRINKAIGISVAEESNVLLEVCFPVREAHIYFHSILIDNLGDLTKFIIQALYHGHSENEILSLTDMGEYTIEEEYDYLVTGGLLSEEKELTELGIEYAQLLDYFEEQKDGIQVVLNTYTDSFEVERDDLIEDIHSSSAYYMPERYSPVLTRNDNYSNSLEIAKKHIKDLVPFGPEIRKSLYTTVRVAREQSKYVKRRFINSLDKGENYRINAEMQYVPVTIPIDEFTFLPRYYKADKHRDIMGSLQNVSNNSSELLSEEGKVILELLEEESLCEPMTLHVNAITGEIVSYWSQSENENTGNGIIQLEAATCSLHLDEKASEDIYLETLSQKRLRMTKFFRYSEMEKETKSEAGSCV